MARVLRKSLMTKFSDLKLDPKVLKAIAETGYETPTPIQEGAIPLALEGRDVLGIAQTGTGKTASFTLPMITLLGRGRARARMPRSLVLCPTRELAAQVAENFDIYAKHTRLTKALLIGGVSFGEQDKLIDRGVDVLIATPGRLLDHFERGKLLLTGVQIMVVDEADRMLDMGFIPDIERIFQLTPFTRQTLFFSATMAPEIERITNTFLHAPERIEIARQASASETISQRLMEITPTRKDQTAKQKRELLRAVIAGEGDGLKNAIIFCNRKTDVDIVAKSLKKYQLDAAPIHGDLDQSHRTRTLDDFREGKLRLLVASDVAARGLDIPAVSHVINFDLPSHAEDYVHRIGRTGRAGLSGKAISLATPADDKYLTAIEALLKQSLPRAELPEGFEVTSSAQSAPKPQRDVRGSEKGGSRRRSHRDDNRKPEQQQDTRPAEAEQKSAAQESPPKPQQHAQRGNQQRDDRRRSNRDDRVVGMGQHVPQFMLVDLHAAMDRAEAEREESPQPELAAENTKPKRRSRKSSKTDAKTDDTSVNKDDAKAAQADDQAAQTAIETASEAPEKPAANEPASSEPVKKPRKTRTRKAKAAPGEGAGSSKTAASDDEAPKPKRTRRKKSEESTATETSGDQEEKAETPAKKPRTTRSRRKKTDDSAEDQARSAGASDSASSDSSEN